MNNKIKKQNKKSQMQIGETVAILAVFFIIMMVTFVFFFRIMKGKLEDEREVSKQLESIEVVKNILNLPEIQCTNSNVIDYACAVQRGNLLATQFHPEKSGIYGLELLKRWLEC